MFWAPGNRAVGSTQMGVVSNPTTATLLAEIDFNGTMAGCLSGGQSFQATWILGAQTTLAVFLCEHTLSTGLDMSTAAASTLTGCQFVVMGSSGQSAQFVTRHKVNPGDRFRVRVNSSFTGGAACYIQAESMG